MRRQHGEPEFAGARTISCGSSLRAGVGEFPPHGQVLIYRPAAYVTSRHTHWARPKEVRPYPWSIHPCKRLRSMHWQPYLFPPRQAQRGRCIIGAWLRTLFSAGLVSGSLPEELLEFHHRLVRPLWCFGYVRTPFLWTPFSVLSTGHCLAVCPGAWDLGRLSVCVVLCFFLGGGGQHRAMLAVACCPAVACPCSTGRSSHPHPARNDRQVGPEEEPLLQWRVDPTCFASRIPPY